ncbi:hypothetical protein ANN_17422 [Periplaneta americana]|uniref:Uncharacterized protein n=1 Tax=Periplaneta americana TaxID=6978 RepID=A0ABQ8STW9_PERAM|nr:hypothetical protein ANN_17422 [Periplaneta americana]
MTGLCEGGNELPDSLKAICKQCADGVVDPTEINFTDEAWFHLHGHVIMQNNRYWSTENPHLIHETPLHDEKVGVCIKYCDSPVETRSRVPQRAGRAWKDRATQQLKLRTHLLPRACAVRGKRGSWKPGELIVVTRMIAKS